MKADHIDEKIIALDIGGTYIKYGVVNFDLIELSRGIQETEKEPKDFLKQLYDITDNAKAAHDSIIGIAISIAGFLNPETGENSDFTVEASFTAYNLKEKLEGYSGYKVVIENDSNCAAIAEAELGTGKDCNSFVMITVGTGIGGAIILNRELVRGTNYKAGEVGFTMIGKNKHAGATSILVKRVRRIVKSRGMDPKSVNGEYVFSHLADPKIKATYDRWIEELAMTIGNIAAILDPQKLLIGGGISMEPIFIKDLSNKIYELFPFKEYTEIVPCMLGNHAGKIGAAILFLQKYQKEAEVK